mgnify:FL=1
MLQSISKYRIYLYLFFFIFLSSVFNFQFLKNYHDRFSLKIININGLPINEKKAIEIDLKNLKNINIFELSEDKVLETLNKYKFLENIYVNKIIPSTININLSKTAILGKTLIDGENFYIGKNGKFINSNQLIVIDKVPEIFGDFKINDFLNLQKIIKIHDLDINKIEKYYYFKNKRWDLLFSDGLILRLPSKDIEKSIKIFKEMSISNNLINTKIIDLRVNSQIILTNKNE